MQREPASSGERSFRDATERSQRRFIAFSVIMAAVVAVNGVLVPAVMGLTDIVWLSLGVLALFTVGPLLAARLPNLTAPLTHVEFGFGVLAVIAVGRVDPLMQGFGTGYLAIIIAASAYILGVRAALVWTIASIVAIVLSATTAAFVEPTTTSELPITAPWLNLSRCLLLLAFFAISAAGRRFADRQTAELEYLAGHDFLTGSLTGHELRRRLTNELGSREQGTTAVLFIDLDRFKAINDTYGHATGDEVLRVMSERLRRAVRETDIVGRIGGDEFVVALLDTDPDDVDEVTQRIVSVLNQPMAVGEVELDLSASVGIDRNPDVGASAEGLFRRADEAMYAAKREGGGRVVQVAG